MTSHVLPGRRMGGSEPRAGWAVALVPGFLRDPQARPACSPDTAELFHGIENSREWRWMKHAIAICHTCPVRRGCLDWALERDEKSSIWGGLKPSERDRLKRKANR